MSEKPRLSAGAARIIADTTKGEKEPIGDFCPVCEAEKNGVEKGSWISGPVEAVFRAAKERGLV